METIGARIAMYRDRQDMTQDDLAVKLNVTRQTVYKYEKGIITNIPLDKIAEMGKIFGVHPGVIAGWGVSDSPELSPAQNKAVAIIKHLPEDKCDLVNQLLTALEDGK